MAYAERLPASWRARFKKPDGTWGSKSGFATKEAALNWGEEQEAEVRARIWIAPEDREIAFEIFAEQWMASARLADNTRAKYRCYLDAHILPKWGKWPLISIFNSHVDIQGWVSQLHEDLAEPSVSSVFALFSTICNSAVRARRIPANPCNGIRVTSGDYETERQVATPAQVLRAAMRLHHTCGRAGFVLCLLNGYTGARWSELAGLEPHEYDEVNRAIPVRTPLRETAGRVAKAKRAKTPAGKRWIQLPDFLAALYTDLLVQAEPGQPVFAGRRGGYLRRGNFRARFWRPAWDGCPGSDQAWLRAPILPGFTFNEGRHTHRTWLAEDGVPEVARAARLGHRMRGMGHVYEHVTPAMRDQVRSALEERWLRSLDALHPQERERLMEMVPQIGEHYRAHRRKEAS
ncbi:tyrosine-type recombinase/integrase [Streptomonospora sp. S1-112]|uniref:Tyrosine-type recombinase/integrase n=1 Tax=Streptomonospora mangrovi TaxID=2883123 RepID=A0A9X3NVS1_9ACTN|nr:tyrosine-type recombinase/integrase [Streptomonospora mangrovi]MDA0565146.1 tyrosine-type recombinase/integrase [Streptomonospora mangrovi]